MPKYKVGDKVKVRTNLEVRSGYTMEDGSHSNSVTPTMSDYGGQVVTIESVSESGYRVREDRNRWMWTDQMLSPAESQYHVGDVVVVRSDIDDVDHPPAMMALAGRQVTITGENVKDVSGGEPGYSIAEDDEMWVWHDRDFTGEATRLVRATAVPVARPAAPVARRTAPVPAPRPVTVPHSEPVTTTKTTTERKSKKMKFNFKKMLSQYMPRAINDGSVALSISGDIAFRRKDSDYVFYDPESKSINNCMDLVLGSEALDKMVFVMPTKDVRTGDVVLNNGKYIYITNITDAGIKGVSLESGRTATLVKEINTVMGFCPYAKVTSLFTMMNGKGGEGINPMFLMLLGDAASEDDLFTTIAMMTMMGGNTAVAPTAVPAGGLFGGMNPLMLLALGGNIDDKDSGLSSGGLTKMILLSQMMGGGLFQAPAAPAAPAGSEG